MKEIQKDFLNVYLRKNNFNQKISALIQRDLKAITDLNSFYTLIVPTLIKLSLTGLLLIIFIIIWQPLAIFIPFLSIILIGLGMMALAKHGDKENARYINSFVHMGERFLDDFFEMNAIIMYRRDRAFSADFHRDSENFRKRTMAVLAYQLQTLNILDFAIYGGIGAFALFLSFGTAQGNLSVVQAIILFVLDADWFIEFRKSGYFIHVMKQLSPTLKHIFAQIDDKNSFSSQKKQRTISNDIPKILEITINNLSIGYDEPLITQLSWSLKIGHLYALSGQSGSGKSTLAKTLMAQQKSLAGEISFSDKKLRFDTNFRHDWLKSAIYLGSEPYLFSGSIIDNLLFASKYDRKELIKIFDKFGLCSFVSSLPDQYDSQVGENGKWLSPGQRQQIAFGRAVAADKNFYIFDEITSNIDHENAGIILRAMKRLAKEKIVLIITHKIEDLKQSDQIAFITGKKAVIGPYESLLKNSPSFKNLINQQLLLLKGNKQDA
ncbi:ATP-binding cassette domain-containing protein [Oenococcus oeni]|uniref:ATP-binding cassette domain-containing protein n=1 Tax=Oenococcus oeni TaxID=1247 RepID=UPI0015D6671B|nr:ATP-binding cassette domain-containing protein [Oenococcus oeni]